MSYNRIAHSAGIPEDDVKHIVNKQSLSFGNPNLLKIADALGYEIDILLK